MKKAKRILDKYISNEIDLQRGRKLLEIKRDMFYSATVPQFYNELGYIEYRTHNIENAVTDIMQLEEIFQDDYSDHFKTRTLLQDCLSILHHDELEIFNSIIWSNSTDISSNEVNERQALIFKKMHKYIKNHHYEILNVVRGEIVWQQKYKEIAYPIHTKSWQTVFE